MQSLPQQIPAIFFFCSLLIIRQYVLPHVEICLLNSTTVKSCPSLRPLFEACWQKPRSLNPPLKTKKAKKKNKNKNKEQSAVLAAEKAQPLLFPLPSVIATRLKQETTMWTKQPCTRPHHVFMSSCVGSREAIPANLRGTVTRCNYALWAFDCPPDIAGSPIAQCCLRMS